jgi:hypothetical protein
MKKYKYPVEFIIAAAPLSNRGVPKGGRDTGGYTKIDLMRSLNYKVQFFIQSLRMRLKAFLLRLGCHFISSWYVIKSGCICPTGQVVKLNHIYAYEDNEQVDIVRLTDIHFERGYLYCSLFFFSKNQIITVRHTLMKGTKAIWRLLDNREFDEKMSIRLWNEVNEEVELLEFDF